MKFKFHFTCYIVFVLMTAHCAFGARLLGVTWSGGINDTLNLNNTLISLDPNTSSFRIIKRLAGPKNTLSLAYNPNSNLLYALAQTNYALYTVRLDTLEEAFVGNLSFDGSSGLNWSAGAIAYDPEGDILYVALRIDNWPEFNGSMLGIIDKQNGAVTLLDSLTGAGSSNNYYITGLSYSLFSGNLYGAAVYLEPGHSQADFNQIVTIEPDTVLMSAIFDSPYIGMHSFTKIPQEDCYYSWVNEDSGHYFGKTIMESQDVDLLDYDDSAGGVLALAYILYWDVDNDGDVDSLNLNDIADKFVRGEVNESDLAYFAREFGNHL
jgi:hypothetical protein